ncbi:MAG TPA: DUF2231 domain-containing protein [Phycisphaerae bacterium]|nr:DUF2231 domain-containing protein [Phycisphaerae bacterium]
MANAIKSFLLGRWLGHPLHPALVHVPIAMWVGALIMDILSLFGVGGNALVRTACVAVLAGLASTLIVVPAGIAEWTQIRREKPAWMMALWHMVMNVCVVLLMIASVIVRLGRGWHAAQVPLIAFTLTLLGDLVLPVSGYVGGRMVYDQGIGIARMSKKRYRRIAAAGRANLPPQT